MTTHLDRLRASAEIIRRGDKEYCADCRDLLHMCCCGRVVNRWALAEIERLREALSEIAVARDGREWVCDLVGIAHRALCQDDVDGDPCGICEECRR